MTQLEKMLFFRLTVFGKLERKRILSKIQYNGINNRKWNEKLFAVFITRSSSLFAFYKRFDEDIF